MPVSGGSQPFAGIKVAIVHDWLVGGGAERVVLELHRMFPEAPIYTSYCTPAWRARLDDKVVTGFLQRWPFPTLRKFVPFLRIWWFRRLKLNKYDLVISSSGAEAKGIRVGPRTLHINYCHAPTHYYWMRYDEYLAQPGFGSFDWLARLGLKLLIGPLRRWDYQAAQRPNVLIANSSHTQEMIKLYYDRDSVIVHPPVDVERFKTAPSFARHGMVVTGRQTPYKRIDIAVEACRQLNIPLTVIGNGPDNAKLRALAGPNTTFLTKASDEEVSKQFRAAQAFLFPAYDDFGIVAVEALAAGTPVIAYRAGGALDYVKPGVTGEFFDEQTVASLENALHIFLPNRYTETTIQQAADLFAPANFMHNMQTIIEKSLLEIRK